MVLKKKKIGTKYTLLLLDLLFMLFGVEITLSIVSGICVYKEKKKKKLRKIVSLQCKLWSECVNIVSDNIKESFAQRSMRKEKFQYTGQTLLYYYW